MSDYLSEDLVDEILTRLPPKSLLRFRSLSKSLCSQIGSRDFIRKHTLQHSPAQKVLFRHQTLKNYRVIKDLFTLHSQDQLPLSPKHGYNGIAAIEFLKGDFDIVGSCNGILCLLNDTIGYTLWNPSIRRKLTIPEDPYFGGHHFPMNGFGFDPITDDYKIVQLYYNRVTGVKKSYVYSMRTGTWFEVASPATRFSFPESAIGCFVNGVLHWIVLDFTLNVSHYYILTFDLSSHVFGTIALPQPRWAATRLMIINGSLGVCFSKCHSWSIRVMRRECNNTPSDWSAVYRFSKNEAIAEIELQLPATGDLLIQSWDDRGIHVLPKTGEESKLVEFNDSSFKFEMEMFVETLELLGRGTT